MEEKEGTAAEQFDAKTLKRADFCMNKCTACKVGRDKGKGFLTGYPLCGDSCAWSGCL